MAVLVGACGTQVLRFETDDAGPDANVEAGREAEATTKGCVVDTDCPLSDLHCDPQSGHCVACLRNDQCQDLNFGVCGTAHQCVECNVDGDCPNGRCEPTTHRCIPSCADGGACPPGLPMCSRSGDCVNCYSSAYCSGYRYSVVCDPAVGQCVQCIDDGDCGGTRPRCDRQSGRCVQCLGSSGCEDWEACDPESHTCVTVSGNVYVNVGGLPGDGGPPLPPHDGGPSLGGDARP
jgi:hypothetical protein